MKINNTLNVILERFKEEKIFVNAFFPSNFSTNPINLNHLNLTTNSKEVKPNSIYIAIRGTSRDGHDYLEEVLSKNCLGIICESLDDKLKKKYANHFFILVKSSREAWAYAESTLQERPEQHLKFFGATGTNGKTSTAWMAYQILNSAGDKAAYCGTIGMYIGDQFYPSTHTTPDPPEFFQFLKLCVEQNCSYICMECSSHAIDQKRFIPIRFDVLAFTSFSRDHLDYHVTMEEYWNAKFSLFQHYGKANSRILWSKTLGENLKELSKLESYEDIWIYGTSNIKTSEEQNFQLLNYTIQSALLSSTNLQFNLDRKKNFSLHLKLIGDFSLDNFSAALLACLHFRSDLLNQAQIFENITAPPGRLEVIRGEEDDICVIVDYAHTPDALEKALSGLKTFLSVPIITVMGCGGNRDKGKRPLMGAIAEKFSKKVYITSDNPRHEKPEVILEDIASGMNFSSNTHVSQINRSKAIGDSILEAETNSCILIAGKGHENYQEINGIKYPFSDRQEAEYFLKVRRLKQRFKNALDGKILILGGGISGEAAAIFLTNKFSSDVLISDQSTSYKPKNASIPFILGEQDSSLLDQNLKLCVLSPGISSKHPLVQAASNKGLLCISEIDLALMHFKGKVIAITGTNGKSTVCKMVEHILKEEGINALAAGNIGLAASEAILKMPDVLVLELSSYQLEQSMIWKADSVCFTSFSQDHLARHGNMENYFNAKWKLFSWLTSQAKMFLPWYLKNELATYQKSFANKPIAFIEEKELETFSNELIHQSARHNKINALMAAKVCNNAFPDLDIQKALQYLKSYQPLAYRFQTVGKINPSCTVINDSKSTNVESSLIAIRSMERDFILMLGGQSKDEDFRAILQDPNATYIKEIYCFGASGEKIYTDLKSVNLSRIKIHKYKTLELALNDLKSHLPNIELDILFSPGCASFDEFKNFEHRGEYFNQQVLS